MPIVPNSNQLVIGAQAFPQLHMAQADTQLVRRFFEATEGLSQEERAGLLGVSQQVVSVWSRKLADKKDITLRKGEARRTMEAYVLANTAPGFAEGVRLAIGEARRALDELEKRLTAGANPEGRATGPGEPRRKKGQAALDHSRLAAEARRRTGTEPADPGG